MADTQKYASSHFFLRFCVLTISRHTCFLVLFHRNVGCCSHSSVLAAIQLSLKACIHQTFHCKQMLVQQITKLRRITGVPCRKFRDLEGEMILPADKGNAMVVMKWSNYDEVKGMIDNTTTYRKLRKDPTATQEARIVRKLTHVQDCHHNFEFSQVPFYINYNSSTYTPSLAPSS